MSKTQSGEDQSAKEQIVNTIKRRQTIRTMNDQFRRSGEGGQTMITRGIQEMGPAGVTLLRRMIAEYDRFTEDNDPYKEHDFGSLTFEQQKIFWKIDYYNRILTAGSPDPANLEVTVRVMTIMLASEY